MSCPAWAAGLPAAPDTLALSWTHTLSMPAPERARQPATVLTLATPTTANAPQAWPELLAQAATQSASNRSADAGALAAQAQSRQVWANAWMPRLDASASSSKQRQTYNGLDSRTPASSLTLSAVLPVWRPADRASARAQAAVAEQAQWQARGNRQSVARELSTAYLTAAEAAEQRRLIEAQLALLQEQLRINERRLQAGAGTVLDVLETRTRVDQARATLQELGTRLASQRLIIERLSGSAVRLPAGLNPQGPDLPIVVPELMDALRQASERSPQLQDTQAQINAAQATTQARQAESWQPTLDAVAQAQRSRQVQQFDGITEKQNLTTQSVGLQLNWPLFTGGYHQGRTQEAAALLSQAQARRDEALAEIDTGLRDAYQTLAQTRGLIEVQRQVEQTATATYEAVRKAFVAGMRTNEDLLNAQQQIYAARQSLVSARITAVSAQVTILALLDQLDPTGVAPLTPLFDTAPLQERTP
ncbi:MAG TPA: TolC family protein [Aquabacterium sp.]|nr:TolC family protein [Aquabacterium sp.]